MVGSAFKVGEQVGPHKAHVDGAFALLQALDVALAQFFLQVIDHFFQGFNLESSLQIVFHKRVTGLIQRFGQRADEHSQLVLRLFGELQILFLHFFGAFQNVHGMVGNTFEIADHLQELCGFFTFVFTDLSAGKLDQIGTQQVLIMVGLIFRLMNGLRGFFVIMAQALQRILHGVDGRIAHIHSQHMAPFQRQRGGIEQTGVQFGHSFRLLGVGHQGANQLFQKTRHGEQHSGAEHVEAAVGNSDGKRGGSCTQQHRIKDPLHYIIQCQAQNRTDHVEAQVDQRGALGVFAGTHGRNKRRDTGTDILTHDDGNGAAEGDLTGHGQGLQHTHRSRGRLNGSRQQCAGQHAQHRVGEHHKQLTEGRHVGQSLQGAGHDIHTQHQSGKAQQDVAGLLALFILAQHHVTHADQAQNGGERGGFEHLHQQIIAADTGQGQQPCRHRGTDVGTHDHVDGLTQGHQRRVNKADHHNGGGCGGLNNARHSKAGKQAQQTVGSQFAKQGAQAVAGAAFQSIAHYVHTKKEQAHAADHRQHIKERHTFLPFFMPYSSAKSKVACFRFLSEYKAISSSYPKIL